MAVQVTEASYGAGKPGNEAKRLTVWYSRWNCLSLACTFTVNMLGLSSRLLYRSNKSSQIKEVRIFVRWRLA